MDRKTLTPILLLLAAVACSYALFNQQQLQATFLALSAQVGAAAPAVGIFNLGVRDGISTEFVSPSVAPVHMVGVDTPSATIRQWLGHSVCTSCGVGVEKTQSFRFNNLVAGQEITLVVYTRYSSSNAAYSATVVDGSATIVSGQSGSWATVGENSGAWTIRLRASSPNLTVHLGNGRTSGTHYIYVDAYSITISPPTLLSGTYTLGTRDSVSAEFKSPLAAPVHAVGIDASTANIRQWIGHSTCASCNSGVENTQSFRFVGLASGQEVTIAVYKRYASSNATYSASVTEGTAAFLGGKEAVWETTGDRNGVWTIRLRPTSKNLTVRLGNGQTSDTHYMYVDAYEVTVENPLAASSCKPVRHYRYVQNSDVLVNCPAVHGTASAAVQPFNVLVPDSGRTVARFSYTMEGMSGPYAAWVVRTTPGATLLRSAGSTSVGSLCQAPPIGTAYQSVGYGELSADDPRVVVNVYSQYACNYGQVAVASGATLDVWVEDPREHCRGRDIIAKSAYGDHSLISNPPAVKVLQNAGGSPEAQHGSLIWGTSFSSTRLRNGQTDTILPEMFRIDLAPVAGRTGALALGNVGYNVDQNNPHSTCPIPNPPVFNHSSRITLNGAVTSTLTRPLPPSQGQGHSILHNESLHNTLSGAISTFRLQVANNLDSTQLHPYPMQFHSYTAGNAGEAIFSVIRTPITDWGVQ